MAAAECANEGVAVQKGEVGYSRFVAALTRARLPWGTPLPDGGVDAWPAAVRKNRLPSTFVKGARGEVGPPHFDLA